MRLTRITSHRTGACSIWLSLSKLQTTVDHTGIRHAVSPKLSPSTAHNVSLIMASEKKNAQHPDAALASRTKR